MRKVALILTLLAVCTLYVQAQDVSVRPSADRVPTGTVEQPKSPLAMAQMKSGDAYIRIVYSQPHLRGRKMLGDNNPFGKMWRLGANASTEILLTKDAMIGGKKLAAGAYVIYAIPEKDKWTLVFNNDLGSWGAYNYDKAKDALRVDVPVKEAPAKFEAFNIWFEGDGSAINMAWDMYWVQVPVKI